MKRITCEMCGSTELLKKDGVFECQNCGTKYTVEEAKKMMVEGTVSVEGTVKIDNSSFVMKSLQNARRAKKKEDWEETERYYNMVEQNDPNNIEAIFFSAYAKAKGTLIENDIYKREAAFKVLCNCISIIDDQYDPERLEENENAIMSMAAALADMIKSSFVYTKWTNSYGITTRTNMNDTYRLFAQLLDSFKETIDNIEKVDDQPFLHNASILLYTEAKNTNIGNWYTLMATWINEEVNELALLEEKKKQEKIQYWKDNPEEKEKLEEEISKSKDEIKKLQKEIEKNRVKIEEFKEEEKNKVKPLIERTNSIDKKTSDLKKKLKDSDINKEQKTSIQNEISELKEEKNKIKEKIFATREETREKNEKNEKNVIKYEEKIIEIANQIKKIVNDIQTIEYKIYDKTTKESNELKNFANSINNEKFECDRCGAEFYGSPSMCPECGAKFSYDNQYICPNCGKRFDGKVDYCPNCGTKFTWDNNTQSLSSEEKLPLILAGISTIIAIKALFVDFTTGTVSIIEVLLISILSIIALVKNKNKQSFAQCLAIISLLLLFIIFIFAFNNY